MGGWGQPKGEVGPRIEPGSLQVTEPPPPPPPVLTTSQRLTQQSIERSTASDLANMVRMYLADGTTGNREAMAQALKEYERVRGL